MSFARSFFLPVSQEDMRERGWYYYDFLLITGDAYVDHPSFGTAVIGRVLEAEGYRVAVLAQPDWHSAEAFLAMGKPRYGVLIGGGNIDSMVAHYTAAKKRRHDDAYSPGRRAGLRPDHATVVYSNRVREAFGDIPIVIGGLEASLRRVAHYDYWEDRVRRSALLDAQADLLTYGMGESATLEIAARLASGTPAGEITDVRGTCFIGAHPGQCAYPFVEVPSFEEVSASKRAYAQANMTEYLEHDAVSGRAVVQRHGERLLIVNPPALPLATPQLDRVAELPYVREPHPMYDAQKGTQFVFSDLGTYQPGDGWNVYSEIKRKLTEDYGIPPSEVRFIQECKTDKARKAVIDAMNAGTVRVLFGSTSMLGTGVNAQKRCVAIHHLDTPWRPSDLQQRDGRGVRAGNEIAKHFAGNNVDVIIYAVEKSLDSYKFNLLHCKQTFISQLKSGAMGARTIDEGAMDEKSGMNFSEYMALLSGNTDLLDKAKLEKRIASLEGERKSFNKGKRDSEFKLESKTGELRNNTAFIDAMTEDWNRFLSVVQTDKEGNRLNIIKVDGVDSADEKVIGKRLQEIAKNATTGGLYTQVGELYGFPIKVVSERILKEGLEFTDNRFVVEGNYKYTYNNGHLAMADPLAAARNFLNAMERIPSIIDQYKAKNEVLEMEIPQLQEIAGKVWKKEDELKQLKSELAALDRKIQLELAPPTPEVAEKENEGQQLKPEAEDVRNRQAQYPENAPPQIRSPADSIVANHVIIGRPGLYAKEETRSKGLKI